MAEKERSVESEMAKLLNLDDEFENNDTGTLESAYAAMNVTSPSQPPIITNPQIIAQPQPALFDNQDIFGLDDHIVSPILNIKDANARYAEKLRFEKNFRQAEKFMILREKTNYINNQNPIDLRQQYFNQLPSYLDERIADIAYSLVAGIKLSPFTALFASLCSIGGASWNRYKVRVNETYTEPLSIYVAIIAPPSSGKTTLTGRLLEPFQKFFNKIIKIYENNEFDAKELNKTLSESIRRSRKQVDCDDVESIRQHLLRVKSRKKNISIVVDNTYKYRPSINIKYLTDKGLVRILEENGGQQIVIPDEAGAWKKYLKKEDNLDLLLEAWSGGEYSRRTANCHPTPIPSTSLNILLMSQPNVVDFIFQDKKLIDRGLPQRFIHLYDEGIQHTGYGFNYDLTGPYNSIVTGLLSKCYTQDLNASRYELYIDREAMNLYGDFNSQLQTHNLKYFPHGLIDKLLQMTIRFAGIIHIYFNPDEPERHYITEYAMRQAIAISECLYQSIKYYYSEDGFCAYTNAIKVFKFLSKLTDYEKQKYLINIGIPLREIMPYVHLKKDKFMPALALLEKHNWLTFGENIDGKEVVIVRSDFWSRINASC